MKGLYPSLIPKNGHRVMVLGIARISTDKQDERSLEDQEASYRHWLDDRLDPPYELNMISTIGSGERLDRDGWRQAQTEVESERYDLVIAEDLGRISRRMAAFTFCELAEDCDTRVITLNDGLDTAREGWRIGAVFSSLHHEQHNADLSKRIQRTLRNRFANGGVVQCPIYGYIKPPGTSTDDELCKDPEAEPIYEQWFRMLEGGATFAAVADWLNESKISPGPTAGQIAGRDRWSAGSPGIQSSKDGDCVIGTSRSERIAPADADRSRRRRKCC